MSVRFRLYGCEKIRRQRLIGECIISFANVNLQLQSNIWVPLEPRANMAVSCTHYVPTFLEKTFGLVRQQNGLEIFQELYQK